MIDEAGGETSKMDETGGDNAFTDRMNSLPKYVASRTLKETPWNNSTLLKGDAAKAVADLKKQDLGNILVHGSGDLIQTLVKHDLVDEYHLMVFPIVLGSGLRLFRDEASIPKLRLVDSKTYKTGVVLLTYQPGKDGK